MLYALITAICVTISSIAFSDSSLWPSIESSIQKDPKIEAQITELVSQMSLRQKIGQMIQAEITQTSKEDVRHYHLGSVLNGGGSYPKGNKYATAKDWLALADDYYEASMTQSPDHIPIPIIWGIDAVHGNNNVYGATIFPHNIGLGATRDKNLITKISFATAREIKVTGVDWDFSPVTAVVQDIRWGRTYESYSEEPTLVAELSGASIYGLQGTFGNQNVIATAKHFIGDGGTLGGIDQGNTMVSEKDLIKIHAPGYFATIEKGVQTVMVSFSSWQGQKMHSNKYLITDILKEKIGFDGIVVTDWDAIQQIPGCTPGNCSLAVNAGLDLFMISKRSWVDFYNNTYDQVNNGTISIDRINDAVTRILRVKMRYGLFTAKKPSLRELAGNQEIIGSKEHRLLAREAARKSMVLLKNKNGILPLSRHLKILVAGKSADTISNQLGGWSLSWQGSDLPNSDFPGATSALVGIKKIAQDVTFDSTGDIATKQSFDVAIVVIGEKPYAEGKGDIGKGTLEHGLRYPEDRRVLETIKKANIPSITIFYSGRPLYVNREINLSDAFIAAFLPGSETGDAISDLIFRSNDNQIQYDFTGKLSFSWPSSECQSKMGDKNYLFDFGYGLNYETTDSLKELSDNPNKKAECAF